MGNQIAMVQALPELTRGLQTVKREANSVVVVVVVVVVFQTEVSSKGVTSSRLREI